MVSSREYDEYVKKHCGRMTLLQQAKTGYTSMGEFDEAFSSLYKNPEIQRKFGVEELAYVPVKPSSILNQMMTDHKVSEGSIDFGNGVNPPIEGGVFVRNASMFNDMGTYAAPVMDAGTGVDMAFVMNNLNADRQQARALQEDKNSLISGELKRQFGADLKSMLEDFYKHQLDRRGGSGKSSLETKTPDKGMSMRYKKYGLVTPTNFNSLEQQAQIDYLTKEFFGSDTVGLSDYMNDTRKFDFVVPQRRESAEEFADLEAREAAIMALEGQKGKGALVPEPPESPKGNEPESPRSMGGIAAFSDPGSRATTSYAP